MKSRKADPFLGYEGIGSRIRINSAHEVVILRESIRSQLSIVIPLLLFGPGLTALLFLKSKEFLEKPIFVLVVLGLASLFSWLFSFRYLRKLFLPNKIELSAPQRSLKCLRHDGASVNLTTNDVEAFQVISTWFSHRSFWIENFTLVLKTKGGSSIDLCTSDSKQNIELVESVVRNWMGR